MQYLIPYNPSNSMGFRSKDNDYLKISAIKDEEPGKVKPFITKLKVLVVEDEPINQIVAKSLLEKKGYQVDIANTGEQALALYQTNPYTAIIMDMGLPDLPGTEVTRHIRELEKIKDTHTPIIACTANDLSAKPECLTAGMDDFLVKPLEIETLNQLLKAWIEKSK